MYMYNYLIYNARNFLVITHNIFVIAQFALFLGEKEGKRKDNCYVCSRNNKLTEMGLILKKRIRQAMDPKDILVSQLILALCIVLVALNVAFFVFFPRLMAPVSIVLSNAITLLLTAIAFRPASTLIQKTLTRRQEELLAQAEKEKAMQQRLDLLESEKRELESRLDTRAQTTAASGDLNFTFKLEQMEYAKKGYIVKEENLDALRTDERFRALVPDISLLDKMLSAIKLKENGVRKILYLRKYYYKVSIGIDFSKVKFSFDGDRILFSGVKFTRLHDISGELTPDTGDINHCWVLDTNEDEGRAEILQSFDYDQLRYTYEDLQELETRKSLDEEAGSLCEQYTSVFRRNIAARFPQVGFVDSIEDSDTTWYALKDGSAYLMVRDVTANMMQLSNVIESIAASDSPAEDKKS